MFWNFRSKFIKVDILLLVRWKNVSFEKFWIMFDFANNNEKELFILDF